MEHIMTVAALSISLPLLTVQFVKIWHWFETR